MKNRTATRAMGTAKAVLLIALGYPFGPLARSGTVEAQTRVALDRGVPLEARVWLDRGEEPLLQQGDQVRVYYRAAEDAYVAIFHIDTDGTATLAFPHSPDEDHYVRGGRDYRLLFPRSPYWYVEDAPGVGYYFIVASDEPFDFRSFRFSAYDRGWDLSQVGRQVYRDPYVAMDDYIAALLPDWQTAPYALDFTTYNVGERHDYPRFLCYECHTFRAYAAWNPYYSSCTNFRVVIYDDPYFYPARRYRGDRVVWAQPPTTDYPRFAFKERGVGEPSKAILSPRPTPEAPSTLRPAVRRSPANGAGGVVAPSNEPTNLGTIRGRPTPVAPSSGTPREGVRPAPTRPTDGAPRARGGVAAPGTGGPPPSARPESAPAAPADTRQRPVLQRRPPEGSSAPAPSSPPARGSEPPQPSSGSGSGSSGRAQPPASPPPSSEGSERSAQPRTSSGSTQSSPPPSSSSGSEKPAVRRTPDGRPVVR